MDSLPVIERGIRPIGTEIFEAKRRQLLDAFAVKVPAEFRLSPQMIANPPLDVTSIPSTCGILTPEEVEITETYDAVGLAQQIASRHLTAVAVAQAFCKRAIIAHQLTCCLTQWFMDEALERAAQLDEHLIRTGQVLGPFHGVPVSIKDHMPMAGHTSMVGFMDNIEPDDKDCLIVRLLREMGAVFYVKTNQPQAGMHLETDSYAGRTLNPYNINLSAGGSSGGEAALIALKGSVLGLGSDIGGSVRGPAGFCGLYGFKPTTYVLPTQGFIRIGIPGEVNIMATVGPLCRTLRDVDFFCARILACNPHLFEARIVPLPWTGLATALKRPLKVGLMFHDGVIRPQPPVAHALACIAHELLHSSHDPDSPVIAKHFTPYQSATALAHIHKMYYPDAPAHLASLAASYGEPLHPLTAHVLSLAEPHELSASQVSAQRVTRDTFRDAFLADWVAQDVDVVLAPVFVGPACAHDTALYWNYTALWNFVDFPAIAVPTIHKVLPRDAYADVENAPFDNEASREVMRLWDEGEFTGAPIGLQIVARRYDEGTLFAALSVLRGVLDLP